MTEYMFYFYIIYCLYKGTTNGTFTDTIPSILDAVDPGAACRGRDHTFQAVLL